MKPPYLSLQLIKLQEENDSLVDKHSKTAQQLQNEDINLPNNLEVYCIEFLIVFFNVKIFNEFTYKMMTNQHILSAAFVYGTTNNLHY